MKKISAITFSLFLISISTIKINSQPVQLNQWDNFENETLQGWKSGNPNPNPPSNQPDGGPGGIGDNYLLVTSNGSAGAGGRLLVYNEVQWIGNYITAAVTVISMHVKNFGSTDLLLRLAFIGPGGNFWTLNAEPIPANSGWMVATFSIQPMDLTGGTDVNATLSNAAQLRILHSVTGGYQADPITAQLGIDNITAAPNPLPVELISFTATQANDKVILNWATATEINNYGFEIERQADNKDWVLKGFVKGEGTSTEKRDYFFIDDNEQLIASRISYRLKQIDYSGDIEYSNEAVITNVVPSQFSLSQNFPNPFNPFTKITYNVKEPSKVVVKIYDLIGNEIKTLVNEEKQGGIYSIIWSGENNLGEKVSSGLYLLRMEAGGFTDSKKMNLLK